MGPPYLNKRIRRRRRSSRRSVSGVKSLRIQSAGTAKLLSNAHVCVRLENPMRVGQRGRQGNAGRREKRRK